MAHVATEPDLYCVVEPDDADALLPAAGAHFTPLGITVIVERRDERAHAPFEAQRQRALHLPRALPPLPEPLAGHADRLRLLQRMPAPGLAHADDPLLAVVGAVASGDGVAASELVWRVHTRVTARLAARHGSVAGQRLVEAALGRLLDRVGEFDGRSETEFLHWLDRVVDTV